ncbi:ABC transporter ATP-binding protein [Corynebacterium kozikiae]|uniref:ABC transporter ATP-binding protein n=1 Tax=Corynebacterium kozikiae TaxID=2968469 RepID=UPI00211BB897|nr:ABC transporter ATP-binding protein [Corynebacterium sp. 76QC2CO]MCQ9342855.1 ABC transporter ATP-binding protein/permease [Corynebacterium sp. 76QC2CO]
MTSPETHQDSLLQDSLKPASVREVLRYLATLDHPLNRKWWLGMSLLNLVVLSFMVSTTTVLGYSVDVVTGTPVWPFGEGTDALVGVIVTVCLLFLADALGRAASSYFIGKKLRTLAVDLRRKTLHAVLQAPIPAIMELGTGNVITRMTRDIEEPLRIFGWIGQRIFLTAFLLPMTFISLVLLDWRFGLVVVLMIAIMYLPVRAVIVRLPEYANSVSVAESRRNATQLDTLRGLGTIRAFGFGTWAAQRFERDSWVAVRAEATKLPLILRLLQFGQLAYALWFLGVLFAAIWLVQSDAITLGQASAAVFLVFRAEVHIFNVMFFTGEIQQSFTSLGRVVALATINPEKNLPYPEPLDRPVEIRMSNLGFAYPHGAKVLEGLNLTLAPGSTTALVGTSGAGKSTLAQLIAGLHAPTEGSITVGEHNIAQVDPDWVAQNITLVSQENHVFSGTLREDLRLAAPEASDEHLLHALAEAGLDQESVAFQRAFPHALDTLVGANHHELPPEIAQHIALARVVLKQPKVLILDEATSEAGSDTAQALEDAATRIVAGSTALVVAHRLNQAVDADRILVMSEGSIVEDGTHAELLALGGRYAQLYARWSGGNQTV